MRFKPEALSGWGRFPVVQTRSLRPERMKEVSEAIRWAPSCIARGLGRSYGDASLNSECVVRTERLNRFLALDQEAGLLACEAGASLDEILQVVVPRGWFLPVTPGTRFVTVGGAIACDVHGKDHHQAGSFGEHVEWIRLLLASGEVVECSPQQHADLFWATVGGLGLTGLIVEACFRLRRIPSAWIRTTHIRTGNLQETLAVTQEKDRLCPYSVVWMDLLASGASLGRGVVMLGEWASPEEVNRQGSRPVFQLPCPRSWRAPGVASWALNPWTVKCFNQLRYSRSHEASRLEDYRTFFYPLDSLLEWNRVYGKRGFLQYQFVVPEADSAERLKEVLELLVRERTPSYLAVLKRFGPAGRGLLSFPMEGYTLAMDFPVRPSLFPLLEKLDERVVRWGGRIYLGKDARLARERFEAMEGERLARWREVKRRCDPDNRFRSELSARLGLTP